MFANRNWHIMSWVGHNIFGNRDGIVLDDPANKASKIRTKDQVVSGIVGYKPQTLVTIEYIQSLDDWKTAWNHIHFRGFLGVKMIMQFTWQGCDSVLAGPLVLDLAAWRCWPSAAVSAASCRSWPASSRIRWAFRNMTSSSNSICSKPTFSKRLPKKADAQAKVLAKCVAGALAKLACLSFLRRSSQNRSTGCRLVAEDCSGIIRPEDL